MKRYLKLVDVKSWIFAVLTPILTCVVVFLEMKLPKISAQIIDVNIPEASKTGNLTDLRNQVIYMVLYTCLILLLGFLSARCSAIAGLGFTCNMRTALYNKVQDFSFNNIDKFTTASLITRIDKDTSMIQSAFSMTIVYAIKAPITVVYAFYNALNINTTLSKAFIVVIPATLAVTITLGFLIFPRYKKMLEQSDKMGIVLQENLLGIRVVKAFGRENEEIGKFEKVNMELFNATMKAKTLFIFFTPILLIIMMGCLAYVNGAGVSLIYDGTLQIGTLNAFTSYLTSVISAVMMLTLPFMTIIAARASFQRVNEVLDTEPSMNDNDADPELTVKNGDITFENVSFKYNPEAEKNVLSNLNFSIKSGETIGIIGATGSAKTTLVSLIPRLYDVTEGAVYVGGENVKSYTFKNLRDGVSIVLQKNTLFSGTIKENLLWGDPLATDEEVERACISAQADEFIRGFEEGYDTKLGQGGINVSGGQKQRLCIARALLKKGKIVIFDDSTSAVDTATDAKIRDALKNSYPNLTKIIIAQRIISIKHADRIIVLDDGKINGFGTHDELMENNEIYREIFYSQQEGGVME